MSLFKGTHTVTRADKISNFTVNTAEYGAPVMEVLGTTRVSGNVIYYDDFTAHEHKETQRTGKGGKSSSTNITYTYTVAVILGLCEGPVTGIGKVWKNKEVYDYPDDNIQLTLFTGTQNQQPWSYVVGKHPERALAYEGLAYMAGVIDLGDSASLPSYNFEVKGKLLSTGDGIDVNPMDYIKYVLGKVGQGSVTFAGESNFRSYCANADLLISTPADATGTSEAQKVVNEIAQLCGAYVFWSNDSYKIVPLADRPVGGWTPDKTIRYDLTEDDFIPQNGSCVTWARKDSTEQYNRFTVEFMNRANSYEKESVTYEDTADIAERGVIQAPTINAGYIYTRERAVVVAEAAARRNKVGRNQYQFKLGWAFCRLEPGDLVRITDTASGIDYQPVMITNVQESADGLLAVTAISWFDADYGAAQYDVHEVDRPNIDFNVPPGDTAVPVIFQPPADLTANGLEVWIAAKGENTDSWGGCTVYVSDDDEYYRTLGQITNTARFGPLAGNITADATTLEVTVNGTMLSGSQQDAQRANTLLWIDGECLSYQTATLLQNGNYQLSGLIRGQYNTTAAAHNAGAMMVRCDEALLRAPFFKEDIGKTLYLKFCSYNIFGAAEQSLDEVDAYQYVLQSYYIPPVTNITAYNRYRQIQDGVARYDIVVNWTPPNLQSYMEAEVWYKTNHAQANRINVVEGVPADQLGYQGEWVFGGSGQDRVVIPQAIVGDTYKIAVCTKDQWGAVTSPDFAPYTTILVALKTETPNTPDNAKISFTNVCTVSWNEVTNSDIAFYEIRKDTQAGVESSNLLARTNGLAAAVTLTERRGTLYIYARSPIGKYSAPAVLEYYKPTPKKPQVPMLKALIGGFSVATDDIPVDCFAVDVYIDGSTGVQTVHSENTSITHSCDPGIYDVKYCFVDYFGRGTWSDEARVTVLVYIDPALIQAESLSLDKMDRTIKTAVADAQASATELLKVKGDISDLKVADDNITATVASNKATQDAKNTTMTQNISQLQVRADNISSTVVQNKEYQDGQNTTMLSRINQNATSVTSIVGNLNNTTKAIQNYSAIAQMSSNIELRVRADQVISKINMSPETITIDGKYIHITGNTVFDNNVIARGMIQAGAVTADKMNVSSLSAICATIGTLRTATSGARLEVTSSVIRVYDANNKLRVRMGIW